MQTPRRRFIGVAAAWLWAWLMPASAMPALAQTVTLDDVRQGQLLFRTLEGGRYEPAPTVSTDVAIRVTGPVARASVVQTFRNPGEQWREAVYAFPLPEGAAVDRLRLYVGGRVIEGQVQARGEARTTYEQARAAGKRTALVEQHRPNLFTTSVANIPPGDEIRVELAYQERVAWRDGRFGLRYPMAATPRYQPGGTLLSEGLALDGGWAVLPGEIPNTVPFEPGPPGGDDGGTVDLRVELDAGFPLALIEAPSHEVHVLPGPGEVRIVELAEGPVPADRDFVIHWQPEPGAEPHAAFFHERHPSGDYGLLMVMPPHEAADGPTRPREIVFVIDTSGSMGGVPLRGAKAALAAGIRQLSPADRFNVIRFDSVTEALFRQSETASPQSRDLALEYIDGLGAGGGTEILQALREALGRTPHAPDRLQQIVFVTDGAVGNEEAVFRLIHERLGSRRLFTVGIGAAPNSHFMTEAAHFGRGTYTYVASPETVEAAMTPLLGKLARPVLTDVQLSLDAAADVLPDPVPDLYAGEPVVAVMRLDGPAATGQLTGRLGRHPWRQDLGLRAAGSESGISVLWAREKVRQWMRKAARGEDADRVAAAVTELGLTHHLVTRYTSLVAVDVTPVRPAEADLDTRAIQGRLPAGLEPRLGDIVPAHGVQVTLAAGATRSRQLVLAGLASMLAGWLVFARTRRAGGRA